MKYRILQLLFVFLLHCPGIYSQSQNSSFSFNQQVLDQYILKRITSTSPGIGVGLIRKDELLMKKVYGYQHIKQSRHLSEKNIFNMASLTKQFTAMCILLLEESGKLSTSDDIRKYLSEFPVYDTVITIDNLLYHTSGIKDYVMLMNLSGNDIWSEKSMGKVYKLLASQQTLNFRPGSQFSYSNSGYFLLGEIIRRVSGESISVFAEQKLFKPLGMSQTFYCDDTDRSMKLTPLNYERLGDSVFQERQMSTTIVGSTGLYSTMDDFAKWDANFYLNKLGKGKQGMIDKFFTKGRLSNGKEVNYGCGIFIGTYKQQPFYFHTGLFGGFQSFYYRLPNQRSSVIVFSNGNDMVTNGIDIVDMLLFNVEIQEKEFSDPLRTVAFNSEEYTGDFDYTSGNYTVIEAKNDQLRFQVSGQPFRTLIQTGEKVFVTSDRKLKLTFIDPVNNRFSKILFQRAGASRIDTLFRYAKQFQKIPTGLFYSEELLSTINFELSGNKVKMICSGKMIGEFLQIDERTLIGDGSTIGFTMENGMATGFVFNSSRTKNIRFVKK